MTIVLFAAVIVTVCCLASRDVAAAKWGAVVCLVALFACAILTSHDLSAADEAKSKKTTRPEGEPVVKKLVKPANWPKDHPLPIVGSNCASCHLTAGRELTAAVTNFVRSVHDLNEMTCYDCHGGNTRDDVKAHEEQFGFIGTKKSAHIKNCSECHEEAAEVLTKGPHGWDFSKKINTDYPLCFDCHGNHDIGNPPADFKLAAMCGDCHDNLDKQFPNIAAVVKENDRLWDVMRQVRKRNIAQEEPIPAAFADYVSSLRGDTMQAIHAAKEVPADKAGDLNKRAAALRNRLENWLKSNP